VIVSREVAATTPYHQIRHRARTLRYFPPVPELPKGTGLRGACKQGAREAPGRPTLGSAAGLRGGASQAGLARRPCGPTPLQSRADRGWCLNRCAAGAWPALGGKEEGWPGGAKRGPPGLRNKCTVCASRCPCRAHLARGRACERVCQRVGQGRAMRERFLPKSAGTSITSTFVASAALRGAGNGARPFNADDNDVGSIVAARAHVRRWAGRGSPQRRCGTCQHSKARPAQGRQGGHRPQNGRGADRRSEGARSRWTAPAPWWKSPRQRAQRSFLGVKETELAPREADVHRRQSCPGCCPLQSGDAVTQCSQIWM